MRNITTLIITTLVLLLSSCSTRVKDVSMAIEKMAVSSKEDTINFKFKELIGSKYDNLLVVPPYTMVDRVEKDLGINLEQVEKLGIERRDDIYVLCLFRDKILTEHIILKRNVDYSGIADLNFIKKGTELSIVKKQGMFYIEKARY